MSVKGPTPSPRVAPVVSGWRSRALLLSVLVSALGYLVFALVSGWREVAAAIAQAGLFGLMFVLTLSLTNYGLRFARWQLYLHTLGHRIPWRTSLHVYLAGFALTATPGKAGEAFRGVLLKRHGVPYPDSFAAFVSERLSDLVVIVLLAFFGMALYPKAAPLILLAGGGGILFLMLLSQPQWFPRLQRRMPTTNLVQPWIRYGVEILQQASRCHRLRTLTLATILGLAGWTAEVIGFFLILHWLNLDVSIVFAAFVFAVSVLAGALSFTPGGLGSTEAVMIGLLLWKGVALPDATAATLLIRACTLWFAVVIGSIASSFLVRSNARI